MCTLEKLLSLLRALFVVLVITILVCQVCSLNVPSNTNPLRELVISREKRAKAHSTNTTLEASYNTTLTGTNIAPRRHNMYSVEADEKERNLYILTMAPFPAPGVTALWEGGLVLMPAALLAAKQINSAQLLGDYRINIVELNSACSTYGFYAAQEYIQHIYHGSDASRVVGIVGPACSDSSFLVGELNNRNPLVQFIIATSSSFRNKTRFPYILSTISSSLDFVDTLLDIALQRNWTRIGVILEVIDYFIRIEKALVPRFKEYSISVTTFNEVNLDSPPEASTIVESDLRVIILLASERVIEKVLCELYINGGLAYPAYQWILVERTGITYSSKCTDQQTKIAFEQSILLEYSLQTSYTEKLVSNQTFDQYYSEYLKEIEQYEIFRNESILPGPLSSSIPYAHPYYDAVWALGLGLRKLMETHNITELLNSQIENSTLTSFPDKGNFTKEFIEALYNVEPFYGASTYQNISGAPNTAILISQIRNGVKLSIGTSIGGETAPYLNGTFIEDHFNIETEFNTMPNSLFVISLVVILCATSVSIFFHVVNIYFQKHRSIRASSPQLNTLIFMGCYSMALGIILYIVGRKLKFESRQTLGDLYCYSHWILIELGTTIILATIFCRTWRIYRIFMHFTQPGGKLLKDYTLIAFTIGLLIPTLLNTLLTVGDPFKLVAIKSILLYDEVSLTFKGTKTEKCIRPIWHTIFFYLYNVFLLLCSFTLALFSKDTTTRFKVKVVKSISFLLFSQVLITSIGFPLLYISQTLHWNIVTENVIFCCTFSTLLLISTIFIFLPPALPVFRGLFVHDKNKSENDTKKPLSLTATREVVVIF